MQFLDPEEVFNEDFNNLPPDDRSEVIDRYSSYLNDFYDSQGIPKEDRQSGYKLIDGLREKHAPNAFEHFKSFVEGAAVEGAAGAMAATPLVGDLLKSYIYPEALGGTDQLTGAARMLGAKINMRARAVGEFLNNDMPWGENYEDKNYVEAELENLRANLLADNHPDIYDEDGNISMDFRKWLRGFDERIAEKTGKIHGVNPVELPYQGRTQSVVEQMVGGTVTSDVEQDFDNPYRTPFWLMRSLANSQTNINNLLYFKKTRNPDMFEAIRGRITASDAQLEDTFQVQAFTPKSTEEDGFFRKAWIAAYDLASSPEDLITYFTPARAGARAVQAAKGATEATKNVSRLKRLTQAGLEAAEGTTKEMLAAQFEIRSENPFISDEAAQEQLIQEFGETLVGGGTGAAIEAYGTRKKLKEQARAKELYELEKAQTEGLSELELERLLEDRKNAEAEGDISQDPVGELPANFETPDEKEVLAGFGEEGKKKEQGENADAPAPAAPNVQSTEDGKVKEEEILDGKEGKQEEQNPPTPFTFGPVRERFAVFRGDLSTAWNRIKEIGAHLQAEVITRTDPDPRKSYLIEEVTDALSTELENETPDDAAGILNLLTPDDELLRGQHSEAAKNNPTLNTILKLFFGARFVDPQRASEIVANGGEVHDIIGNDTWAKETNKGTGFNVDVLSGEVATKVGEAVATGKRRDARALGFDERDTDKTRNSIENVAEELKLDTTSYDILDDQGKPTGKADNFTKKEKTKIKEKLDALYGEGQWILKESLGAAGSNIYKGDDSFLDQDVTRTSYLIERFDPMIEAMTASSHNEFRAHVIKRNGKISVIPYATLDKKKWTPFLFRSKGLVKFDQQVEDQAQTLLADAPDGLYGFDVINYFDNINDSRSFRYEVVETNPTSSSGRSGYVSDPFVQLALYAHLKGKVPAHVRAARIMARKRLSQLKAANKQVSESIAADIVSKAAIRKEYAEFAKDMISNYGDWIGEYTKILWQAVKDYGKAALAGITDFVASNWSNFKHYVDQNRVKDKFRQSGTFLGPLGGKRVVGETLAKKSMANARRLYRDGVDGESIRKLTGWYINPVDGQFRWEIPDKDARVTEAFNKLRVGGRMLLKNAYHHPELYKAYPSMGNIYVTKSEPESGAGEVRAGYTVDTSKITISPKQSKKEIRTTFAHEIQHLIQLAEGHPYGGDLNTYRIVAGRERAVIARWEIDRITKDLARVTSNLRRDKIELAGFKSISKETARSKDLVSRIVDGKYAYSEKNQEELKSALNDVAAMIANDQSFASKSNNQTADAYSLAQYLILDIGVTTVDDAIKSISESVAFESDNAKKIKDKVSELEKIATKSEEGKRLSAAEELFYLREISDEVKLKAYNALVGEKEAKEVERRINLGAEGIRKYTPFAFGRMNPEDSIITWWERTPETQSTETNETQGQQNQEQTSSSIPAQQGFTSIQHPEVEASRGTPQRQGQGPQTAQSIREGVAKNEKGKQKKLTKADRKSLERGIKKVADSLSSVFAGDKRARDIRQEALRTNFKFVTDKEIRTVDKLVRNAAAARGRLAPPKARINSIDAIIKLKAIRRAADRREFNYLKSSFPDILDGMSFVNDFRENIKDVRTFVNSLRDDEQIQGRRDRAAKRKKELIKHYQNLYNTLVEEVLDYDLSDVHEDLARYVRLLQRAFITYDTNTDDLKQLKFYTTALDEFVTDKAMTMGSKILKDILDDEKVSILEGANPKFRNFVNMFNISDINATVYKGVTANMSTRNAITSIHSGWRGRGMSRFREEMNRFERFMVDLARKYKIDSNSSERIGIAGMMIQTKQSITGTEELTTELQTRGKNILESYRNYNKHVASERNKKRSARWIKNAEDILKGIDLDNDNYDDILDKVLANLNENELNVLAEIVKHFNADAKNMEITSELFYGKDFERINNYFPTLAHKFTDSIAEEEITETDALNKSAAENFEIDTDTIKKTESGALKERVGINPQNRYYQPNFLISTLSGKRKLTYDKFTGIERRVISDFWENAKKAGLIQGEVADMVKKSLGRAASSDMRLGYDMSAIEKFTHELLANKSASLLSSVRQLSQGAAAIAHYTAEAALGTIVGGETGAARNLAWAFRQMGGYRQDGDTFVSQLKDSAKRLLSADITANDKVSKFLREQGALVVARLETGGFSEMDLGRIDAGSFLDDEAKRLLFSLMRKYRQAMSIPIRYADGTTSRILFMAYYAEAMNKRGVPTDSIDLNSPNWDAVFEATRKVDTNMNNALRSDKGSMFHDKTKVARWTKSLFLNFKSHSAMLAGNVAAAIRDIKTGITSRDMEMVNEGAKYIAGAVAQTAAFAAYRWYWGAYISSAIYEALAGALFDDDDEEEKKSKLQRAALELAKNEDKDKARSIDALVKGLVRDTLGFVQPLNFDPIGVFAMVGIDAVEEPVLAKIDQTFGTAYSDWGWQAMQQERINEMIARSATTEQLVTELLTLSQLKKIEKTKLNPGFNNVAPGLGLIGSTLGELAMVIKEGTKAYEENFGPDDTKDTMAEWKALYYLSSALGVLPADIKSAAYKKIKYTEAENKAPTKEEVDNIRKLTGIDIEALMDVR